MALERKTSMPSEATSQRLVLIGADVLTSNVIDLSAATGVYVRGQLVQLHKRRNETGAHDR